MKFKVDDIAINYARRKSSADERVVFPPVIALPSCEIGTGYSPPRNM
jgi:hypothetical protein